MRLPKPENRDGKSASTASGIRSAAEGATGTGSEPGGITAALCVEFGPSFGTSEDSFTSGGTPSLEKRGLIRPRESESLQLSNA